jgi:WD40 repeat protein
MKAIEVALSTLNSARPILENTKEMIQSRLGELKSGGSNESDKNGAEESVNIMLKHLETIASQTISKRAVLAQMEVNQLLYLEHDSPVASFAVSPNDRFLVSQDVGNAKYGFHIWDLERDEKLKTIEMDKGIGKMNFSFTPDSKYLLAGYSNGDVWILSFPDLKKVGEIHAHEKNAELLGYSSNDQWLLTRGTSHKSGELCSWKVEKRDTNSPQFTPQAKIALEQDMQSLCFSPTEPLIAYRSTKDRSTDEISVWDVPGLKKIATIQRSNVITSLQFSPDGRTLLIAEQGNVYSWDWKMKAQPRVLFTELGAIKNMHFIRGTGNLAYICSMEVSSIHDSANSTVCIRDINTVKAVGSFYAPDAWSGNFQISPLGKFALKIKKGLTDILVWKLGEIPQKD